MSKYQLVIKGEHVGVNSRSLMFGEIINPQPVSEFRVFDGDDIGMYYRKDKLSVWLEEYKHPDDDQPYKSTKIFDGSDNDDDASTGVNDSYPEPMLCRYSISESDGEIELPNLDEFDIKEFSICGDCVEYPDLGLVNVVSGFRYGEKLLSAVDIEDEIEHFWVCRYKDLSCRLTGERSLVDVLSGFGYRVANHEKIFSTSQDFDAGYYEKGKYYEVGRDTHDKTAVFWCAETALPGAGGLYPCYVKGFPDTVERLAIKDRVDSNFKKSILKYNPLTAEMQ